MWKAIGAQSAMWLSMLWAAPQGAGFSAAPDRLPQGGPVNNGHTENLTLVDVDLDGDLDAVLADGGDWNNDRNNLWINQGGAQGGATGTFVDETAARLPVGADASRDVDFADLDGDGDMDLFIANSSGLSNQTNRWWINAGGLQGGAPGYFVDETQSRWPELGVNDGGAARSSIDPALVLAGGGFIDWCCDTAFADLDMDGHPDVVQASYGATSSGKVPTRMFTNDGGGRFRELNPSGFQLAGSDISAGEPGLWCEGAHQPGTSDATGSECDVALDTIAVELGDLDGDLDVDLIIGDRFVRPRLFVNRLEESGGQAGFRDESWARFPGPHWAPSTGNYEQELGDLDGDGDLDLYGVNWLAGDDALLANGGDGHFAPPAAISQQLFRHNEVDWFDFEGDGDLDLFVTSETLAEHVAVNAGAAGGFALVPDAGVVPPVEMLSQAAVAGDVDGDGDCDVLVACRFGTANELLLNGTDVGDAWAPRLEGLEDAPDRDAGPAPTAIRVHVYDNAPWYRVATFEAWLEVSVDAGAPTTLPLVWSGGQVFRGELPGALVGFVRYRALARDDSGNVGSSTFESFTSAPCSGAPSTYCTAQATSSGCTPAMEWAGAPSATASSGFVVSVRGVLAPVPGILFYGTSGPKAAPYLGGTLCVQGPVRRTPLGLSVPGGACGGVLSMDFNAWIDGGADPGLVAGAAVWVQAWTRDPSAPSTTNLSDGLTFVLCP